MVRLLACAMLIGTLLFGGFISSAEAAHDATEHCAELVEVSCTGSTDEHDGTGKDGAPIHVDHHHCGSFVVLDSDLVAQKSLQQDSQIHPARTTVLASRATAPPIQPPAA